MQQKSPWVRVTSFIMHLVFCGALFDGYVSLFLFCALLSVCTLSSHVSRESVLASALPV